MFSLIIVYSSAIDGHSKRKVLEIFNMNKPATDWSIIYDCWQNGQVTYHVTY